MKALIKRSDTLPLHVVQDHVVQRLQQAEEALAYAVGIDQVRLVMDVAAAQEVFATRQRMGEAVIGQAHALKTRALVKLGELLEALPKAGPQHSKGGGSKGSTREPLLDAPATYAELGVTKKLASVAQQLAALPEATREAIATLSTSGPFSDPAPTSLLPSHVDTAFMPISDLRRLIVAGLGSRVLFGSDVPIDRCYRRGEPRPRYRRRLAAVARTAGRWAQDVMAANARRVFAPSGR